MASLHMAVKSVKRSQGRSAVAAAAYRAGCRLECAREGRAHDYGRKRGVEASFILAPEGVPKWVSDRERLWNAAEAAENRKNSIVAREWELALPCELGPERRRELAGDFARALVDRFGVAVDVAIHAPHPAGDQRNHHAHVLTTTRAMGAEGLGAKTRVLDVATRSRGEVTAMRELWCGLQNAALELAERERGLEERALDRVDPRTLAAQREEALAVGDRLRAEELDRAPEVKLGPVVSGVERRAQREAVAAGVAYEPVTERGAQVHEARRARALFAEMRAGLEVAREKARELGAEIGAGALGVAQEARGAWTSGWSALRGAAARLWGGEAEQQGSHAAEERSSQAASQQISDPGDQRGREERGAEAEGPGETRSVPLQLGAELRVEEQREPLTVPGPEERAALMAQWRELPASQAREGFVERRAVEWTAMGRHEDPEIAEAGQRPVIRDVEEAAPRFGVEPEVLLAAVVERSEAGQRLMREADERRERQAERERQEALEKQRGADRERARERRQERERAQRLREERESVERVRRIIEGKQRAQERGRERRAFVEETAQGFDAGLMGTEALAGIVPSEDALAPLRAAEAALEGRLTEGAARLGVDRDRLVDAVVERTEALRRAREAGEPEAAARMEAVQRAARGPFVEANARAWDAALWAEERETARMGHGRAPGAEPEPGSSLARERERLGARIEWAAVRLGEPEAALRSAIQARADALDREQAPAREAEVARLEAEGRERAEAAEREARKAQERRMVEELGEIGAGLGELRAALERSQAREREQAREERRRWEAQEALRGRAVEVLEAEGSYAFLHARAKEAVREELVAYLGPAVGPEGLARLGRGEHAALEGVLPSEADRIAVTQAHLFMEAERTGDPAYEQRGRALHVPLHDARVAEEDRALERENEERRALGLGERERGRDLDDGLEL